MNDGWDIEFRSGEGTFSVQEEQLIVIDYADNGDPFQMLSSLAHEVAHAKLAVDLVPIDSYAKLEDYITAKTFDEGNAVFAEFEIMDDISEPWERQQYYNNLKADKDFDAMEKIYDDYKNGTITADVAKAKMGEIYSHHAPSGLPFATYKAYRTSRYHDHGPNNWYNMEKNIIHQQTNIPLDEICWIHYQNSVKLAGTDVSVFIRNDVYKKGWKEGVDKAIAKGMTLDDAAKSADDITYNFFHYIDVDTSGNLVEKKFFLNGKQVTVTYQIDPQTGEMTTYKIDFG